MASPLWNRNDVASHVIINRKKEIWDCAKGDETTEIGLDERTIVSPVIPIVYACITRMQLFSFYFFFFFYGARESFLISVLVRGIKAITHAMSRLRACTNTRWIAIGHGSRAFFHCSIRRMKEPSIKIFQLRTTMTNWFTNRHKKKLLFLCRYYVYANLLFSFIRQSYLFYCDALCYLK